jgi:TorA maturation chaperone TorD
VNDQHRPAAEATAGDWEAAIGRAAVYGFIARSLLYPTAETWESLRVELTPLLDGLSSTSERLDELIVEALDAQNADFGELQRAHGRVFTHIENMDCPAHESAYCPGDVFRRADVMADVAAFYTAHGLRVGGSRRERVDHVATELEFLSFLARKEAYAIEHLGPGEVEECRRSQAHFLRDHVACWVPGFAGRLQVVADHRFLMVIGSLLATWIESDLEWLGVEASAPQMEPQPPPLPDDGGCGADSGGLAGTPVEIRS